MAAQGVTAIGMTGLRKAAILLVQLGRDKAVKVMARAAEGNDRLVATRNGNRVNFRLPGGRFPRRGRVAFRVTAFLSEDQAYTPGRRVQVCRRSRSFLPAGGGPRRRPRTLRFGNR